MSSSRPVALVTGACGGIGQACCRLLGQSHDLVLTDIRDDPLNQFAEALGREGHEVLATAAGDLSDEAVAANVADQARATGRLAVVIHTAGLSPALADWRKIFWANFVATGRLLDALEADLPSGLRCVAISSMAGHTAVPVPELDDLFAAPVSGQTIGALETALAAMEDPDNPGQLGYEVYGQTKRAVIRMAQARCIPWGKKAARINTISPGLIRTPMGTAEVEIAPQVRTLITAAPMGRWGTPIDIAQAAAFLVSDQSSFVTGADLRVDGGVTPALMAMSA